MSRCSNCQNELEASNKFCKKCGVKNLNFVGRTGSDVIIPASEPPPMQRPNAPNYNPNPQQQPNHQRYAGYKTENTTLILAIVLGLFGLCGIGHMYVGRVGRGIGLLIGAIVLAIIGGATLWFGVGIIFIIGVLVLFIWQIFDARKLCREYNDYFSRNGQPPW